MEEISIMNRKIKVPHWVYDWGLVALAALFAYWGLHV